MSWIRRAAWNVPFLAILAVVPTAAVEAQNPDIIALNQQSVALHNQGEDKEATAIAEKAAALAESTLGPDHPDTLESLCYLASLYEARGLYGEAEPLLKRVLEGFERTRGAEDLQTVISADNLGSFYRVQGREAEAEPLLKRALAGFERTLGPDHRKTLSSTVNLAALHFRQGDWLQAVELWRRGTAAIASRTLRGSDGIGPTPAGNAKDEAGHASSQFLALVKAAYRLTPQGGMPDAELSQEMFKAAQWVQDTTAAQSLRRMALRIAAEHPVLAGKGRERQDLVSEWQKRDALRNAALGQTQEKRDAEAEAENMARLVAIDARIEEIDKDLAENFPGYVELASPAPIAVEEVQALLGEDEALVLFLDSSELGPAPEESFIWVVTRTASRWVRSAMGTPKLAQEVLALRCGLDGAAGQGPRCAQLTGQPYTDADRSAGNPLPFDRVRAHRLYEIFVRPGRRPHQG